MGMHVAGQYGYFLCSEHKVDEDKADEGKQIYPCELCGKPGHAFWYYKEKSLTSQQG